MHDALIDVLGIDISLDNLGMCAARIDVETCRVHSIDRLWLVHPEKETSKQVRRNSSDLDRACQLRRALHEAAEGKALAIVEIPVGSKSARAMASYGICIGVLASCPIPLIQVTPLEVKLAATGSKTATKRDMIEWAVELYPDLAWRKRKRNGHLELIASNEHMADAIAAVHAGVSTSQFAQATAMYKRMIA